MADLKKTVSVLEENKKFVDEALKKNNILGFADIENKDCFMFAVSLGLTDPSDKEKLRGASGWFRTETIRSIYEKANYQAILLGRAASDEVEEAVDLQNNLDMSERCANSGFEKLKKLVDIYQSDNDLICKKMMADLDLLFEKNINM